MMSDTTSKASAPPRRKIKKLEVMVADVIRETPDSATLVLFTGNDQLEYQPGHFLTIDPHQFPALQRFIEYFEEMKGKREPARAYSLASAPHEKYLAITVKEEYYISGRTKYPPLLSPLLVWRTQPGTRMVVTGFGGPYVLPADIDLRTDHLVHVCAGSGIVPNWSIIKHALAEDLQVRHTLIYGNKTFDDIIFRRELEALQRQYPNRIEVLHALSREEDVAPYGQSYQSGRVDETVIQSGIPDPSAVTVFACGPGIGKWERLAAKESGNEPQPRFLESALAALESIGVPKANIRYESYG
jgi:3-ketosteroid 9alpha-monooxygenase subunit B